jgi:hypothetical protein
VNDSNPSRRVLRTDAAQHSQWLEAFDRIGLSGAEFARQNRLNYTTFCAWRQQRDRTKASPGFVQVDLLPERFAAELVIELGPAARMHLRSIAQIALAARLLRNQFFRQVVIKISRLRFSAPN